MIKKALLFLLFTCSVVATPDPSKKNKPATVRVLLAKLAQGALVEVRGRYLIYNPKSDELIATGGKKKKAKIQTRDTGLYWNEEFPGIFEIRIVPSEESASILIEGVQYKGCVEIYSIGGTINIVNEVDIDHYLKSILGSKINQKFTRTTLDAIAITERTQIHYLTQKDAYASWQVEADAVGYKGLAAASKNLPVSAAIDRTRNLILHYQKKPFAASWSENNAGRSIRYNTMLRKACHSPHGVDHLPSLQTREKARWRNTVPIKTLEEICGLSPITSIDLFRAKNSRKVYALRFRGPNGKRDLRFIELQKLLGKTTLLSSDFTLLLKNKKAYLSGYGKGLGVGLCAESAEILAKKGSTTKQILSTHFPGSELLNLREEKGSPIIKNFIWN